MPETKIQKIWKDPVWSKVISALIITSGTVVYSYIISKSKDITFISSFNDFWNSPIKLWIVVVAFIVYLVIVWIKKYYQGKKNQRFVYDDKTLALDTHLFDKIRKDLLPQDGTIYWLRHNNFAGFSFNDEYLNQLDNIEYEARKSDFEFLNPELEILKNDLIREINTFTSLIAVNTFPTHNGRQTVPPEWEEQQSERFWNVVNEIHKNKDRVCESYDKLITSGRRILKV
ncbi:large-conductance mechanosensitive channel [Filimonas zeae]|uniref:Uncharacterized protein n=1 Tax=Filimonas zeae TaxID=1737353 RepID=A0A917J1U1_9BACT|nr:hypothetical protein [Filimonas zeae]MDR6339928.1 large-conductance mechanosensitive channel [Filimonas zeae]GGH70332.1 hypothetical protein GCM10011379_28500 [Filimonas zeae]